MKKLIFVPLDAVCSWPELQISKYHSVLCTALMQKQNKKNLNPKPVLHGLEKLFICILLLSDCIILNVGKLDS